MEGDEDVSVVRKDMLCGLNALGSVTAFPPAHTALHSSQLQEEQLDCGAAHLQHPLTINRPLSATPLFKAPGLTSVAVANVSGYTVAFLGTAGGQLLKVT